MSVDRAELCCYEYINAIKDIEKYTGQGIYGFDKNRSNLHNELCKLFQLPKERTKKYTDNINLDAENPAEDLYISLLNESRK